MPIEISALIIPKNSKRAGESAHQTINVTKKVADDAKTAVNSNDDKISSSDSAFLKTMTGVDGDVSARYLSEALCATMARDTDPEAKVIIPPHELVTNINTESEELSVYDLNIATKTISLIYGKQKIVGLLTPAIPGIQSLENGISCNKNTLKQLLTIGGFGKIAARRFFFKDCDAPGNIFFIKDPTKTAVTVLQLVELDYGMAFFDSLHAQKLLADKEAEKMPIDPNVFDVNVEIFADKLLGDMEDLPFLAHHVFPNFIKDLSELKKETPALVDTYFSEQYQAYAELVKKGLDPNYAAKLKLQFDYDSLTPSAQQAFDAKLKEISARAEMFKPIVNLGKEAFIKKMYVTLDNKYAIILQKDKELAAKRQAQVERSERNTGALSPLAAPMSATIKDAPKVATPTRFNIAQASDVKLDRINAANGSAFFKPVLGGSSDVKAGTALATSFDDVKAAKTDVKPLVIRTPGERPRFFKSKPISVPVSVKALQLTPVISGSPSTSVNSASDPMSMSASPAHLVGSPASATGDIRTDTPLSVGNSTPRSQTAMSPTGP